MNNTNNLFYLEECHYYRVTTKCGHVGRHYYIPIDFALKAHNKREAAFMAKQLPRVKHHHKDAILHVEEINYNEYVMLNNINKQDDYLKSDNIQKQRAIEGFEERLKIDKQYVEYPPTRHHSFKNYQNEKFKHKKTRMQIKYDLRENREFL